MVKLTINATLTKLGWQTITQPNTNMNTLLDRLSLFP